MQKTSSQETINLYTGRLSSGHLKLAILLILVFSADWLFYGQALGITVPIFITILAVAHFYVTKNHTACKKLLGPVLILSASLLPLIEELNTLTFLIGTVGIINFMLFQPGRPGDSLLAKTGMALLFIIRLPLKFLFDMIRFAALRKRARTKHSTPSILANWIAPILMTSGFLFLFAVANPLIGNWISALDLEFLLEFFNTDRIVFWGFIATLSWSFLKPSYQKLKNITSRMGWKNKAVVSPNLAQKGILNETTVFRSLILFNLLFALQTALDIQYLWIGQSLPSGVTFSQYVHNGTYILIFTTVLAASFILFVTSSKKQLEKSPRIMGLLLAWITQNIILVLSNVMRMELYVEAFALTYLRLGVLIWLTLVVIGLVLIIVRLFKGHSNLWLIKANLISLAAILYLTSFANLPYLIADYNLTAAEQNSNKRLDIHYILELGPNTVPVLDRILQNPRWEHQANERVYWDTANRERHNLQGIRDRFADKANREYADWHQWNFRDYRLQASLNQFQPTVLP